MLHFNFSLQGRWLVVVGLGLLLNGCAALDIKPSQVAWPPEAEAQYAFITGELAQAQGNYPVAAEAYRHAVKLEPRALTLWRALFSVLIETGQGTQAAADFRAEVDARKHDSRWALVMAEVYDASGNTTAAEDFYRRAAQDSDSSAVMAGAWGAFLARQERWTEALPWLKRALVLDPHDRRVRRILLQYYIDSATYSNAHELVQQALAIEPADAAWMLQLGQLWQLEHKSLEAQKMYERVLAEEPENLAAHRFLAELLMERKSWNMALVHLEYVAQHQSSDVSVQRDLATTYFALGQWDAARSLLLNLIEQQPGDGLMHFLLGSIYRGKNLCHLAVQEFLLAWRSPSLRPEVALELAQAYLELQASDKAEACLEEVRADLMRNAQYGLQYALILLRLGKSVPALAALQAVEKLAPYDVRILFQQGRAYLALQRIPQALQIWDRVIHLDPEFAEVFNHLAYTCAENHLRLVEAENWAQHAVALVPDNSAYLDTLGWVYYQQGKYPEAVKALQRAIKKFSDHPELRDPEVYEHMGDVYQKIAQPEAAVKAWEQALNLTPGNLQLQEKIKVHSK